MLQMNVPFWELIIRSAVVYFFLLVAIRLTGRKQVGQLSPLDFILLLILSNAVQNSINAGDNSLIGGLISAATLISIHWALDYISFKNQAAANILEGKPEILIHNGKLITSNLRKEKINHNEVEAILRKNGVMNIQEVRYMVLESSGAISLIRKSDVP